jgi:hypothetical protein
MANLHTKVLEALPANLSVEIANTSIDKDNLLVSYYDVDKAKSIQIKLGRLLTKQTSLTELEIKNLVEFQRRNLKGEVLMELTQDAEDIVDYYTIHVAPDGGSYSCMHNEDCVRVYSYDSNLFLATFYDGADTSLDNYVGRCLVRTDTMEFIRIYSTEQKYQDNILLTLENSGYSKGNLVGIELAKEETNGGYTMPYLDWNGMYLEDKGSYFEVVSYETSFKADSTNGVMKYGCTCGCCGEHINEDDARYTEQEGDVCTDCFNNNYVYFGDDMDVYSLSDCTRVTGGEYDGNYVPDNLLSENDYYEPVDSFGYYHLDELTSYNGDYYLKENCVKLAEETDEGKRSAPEQECTELTDSEAFGDYNAGWYIDERYNEIIKERDTNYVLTPDGWELESDCKELVESYNSYSWAHEDVAYYYDKPTNHLEGWYYETRYNDLMEEFETQSNLFTSFNIAA